MTVRARLLRQARDLPPAVKYLVVGVLSFAIDLGVLMIALKVVGLPLWLATSCGFWCSFSVNFALSRHWTFDAAVSRSTGQLLRYGALVGINYVVTVVAVTMLHRAGLGALEARTLVLVLLTGSTFVLYKRWVFAAG